MRALSFEDRTAVGTRNSLKNRGAIQLVLLFSIFAMLSAAVCLFITP